MAQTASSIFLMTLQTFTMSYETYGGIRIQRFVMLIYNYFSNLRFLNVRNHPKIFLTFKMKVEQDFGNLNEFTTRNLSNPR